MLNRLRKFFAVSALIFLGFCFPAKPQSSLPLPPSDVGAHVDNLMSIVTQTLPTATYGVPYYAKFKAVGGIAPYTWSLSAGSLPAGLTLNPDGTITGTPTGGTGQFAIVLSVPAPVPAAALQ